MIFRYFHTRTCRPCMIRLQYILVYVYYHLVARSLFVVSRFLLYFLVYSYLDIFDTDFWSSCQPVLREVASLIEKLKFTALASRAPGTSISYTSVFNRWRSFAADVLDIFSFELNQKLKVMMRVSRASGTSEYYLRPFDR